MALPSILSLALPLLLQGPVTWQFSSGPAEAERLEVRLEATCEPGWHIYALTLPREDGPLPTVVRVEPSPAFSVAGAVVEPRPQEVEDPNFGMLVRYHAGTVPFIIPIQRTTKEAFTVTGEVEFMVCNDKTCLPPMAVPFKVQVPASR